MTVHLLVAFAWLASDVGAGAATGEVVTDPTHAQARLAEALADADAIDDVTVHGDVVSFVIDHVGERFVVDATTRDGGVVATVAIHDAGRRPGSEAVARGSVRRPGLPARQPRSRACAHWSSTSRAS